MFHLMRSDIQNVKSKVPACDASCVCVCRCLFFPSTGTLGFLCTTLEAILWHTADCCAACTLWVCGSHGMFALAPLLFGQIVDQWRPCGPRRTREGPQGAGEKLLGRAQPVVPFSFSASRVPVTIFSARVRGDVCLGGSMPPTPPLAWGAWGSPAAKPVSAGGGVGATGAEHCNLGSRHSTPTLTKLRFFERACMRACAFAQMYWCICNYSYINRMWH